MNIRDRVYEIISRETRGKKLTRIQRAKIYKKAWAKVNGEYND